MKTIFSLFHYHQYSIATARIPSTNSTTRSFWSTVAISLQHHHAPPSAPLYLRTASKSEAENTLISLIKSCARISHLCQIHCYLIRTSFLLNPTIFLCFLSRIALPPFQNIPYSYRTFLNYPNHNISLYNTMIRAFSLSDSSFLGFELYREMVHFGISADALSLLSALKCSIKMGSLLNGLQVHGMIFRDGHISDCFLSSALVDFYSVNRKYDEACKVFAEMSYRDTVAWNSLISCQIKNKRTRDALTAFDIMERSEGPRPDDVTCLFLLEACANLNALEFGERVHDYVTSCGLSGSIKICNTLVAMYSRCGSIEKAYEVFKNMPRKDVVTWSSMISGLASNGYGRDAIEAFMEMQRVGIAPDDQTFTGVLSGCSHSGLVDEGLMFFDCMRKEFGVVPNIYHYGCMVDLMGRAGLLDKAYELISRMEAKPDAAVWRTLLGACRIHKNAILGERVVEHLIELKAEEAGDYVLLLNIYSSIGDWEKGYENQEIDEGEENSNNPCL